MVFWLGVPPQERHVHQQALAGVLLRNDVVVVASLAVYHPRTLLLVNKLGPAAAER